MALTKIVFVNEETLITAEFLNALQDELIQTQTEVASKSAIFKITITEKEDGSYTADKTFAEAKAAIGRGDELVAVWNPNNKDTYYIPLAVDHDSILIFAKRIDVGLDGGFLDGIISSLSHVFFFRNDETVVYFDCSPQSLPEVTESDNGKMLRVVDGKWVAAELATEDWTFTLEDGSTVTKAVYVG